MLTSLDLLVIVGMALAAVALLALSLMFLLRNRTAKKVFFYLASALGLYASYVGIYIGLGMFTMQVVIGAVVAVVSIGAFVLERVSKGNEKMFLIARIASALALVVGLFNAIL